MGFIERLEGLNRKLGNLPHIKIPFDPRHPFLSGGITAMVYMYAIHLVVG